jgi:putative drug exporter of the RND superfamily
MMSRLAQLAVRRPVPVLVVWGLVVVILAVVGRGVEKKLLPTVLLAPGTESQRWADIRKGHFGEDAAVLLRGPPGQVERQGRALAVALSKRPHTRALSPWSGSEGKAGAGAKELRPTPDRALIVLDLGIPKGENASMIIPPLRRFVEQHTSPPVQYHMSGLSPLGRDLNDASVESIHRAELIAFPVLMIVLLLVFRTPIAAAIPLIIAQGTTQSGFGVIRIITEFTDLDALTLSLASMIGLALGIDYSLLIVTRFREGLAERQPPRQAASLAANTAGRTAVFAGTVLISTMIVVLILSPGSVLLSTSVGAIVVTVISMVGAALVAPAAVTLLGHRVNKWQIGRSRAARAEDDPGVIGRFVQRASGRPLLTTVVVLGVLLALAAPVLALKTIPPDPRQLPKGSRGLEDYKQIRAAGFGPSVDIVLKAPVGPITDPTKLMQIGRFERQLKRVKYVKFVVGPGAVGEQTHDLLDAPAEIRKGKRQLRKAERDLTKLASGLGEAAAGVHDLLNGLLLAASAARDLAAGTGRAKRGSEQLAAGTARARTGANQIAEGNADALNGARELTAGATRARRAAERLAAGNRELSNGLNNRLAPGAEELARQLRRGQAQLQTLRVPAQVTERELRSSLDTLNAMTIGKTDPLFPQALQHVSAAFGAATGRDPLTNNIVLSGYQGLDASLQQAADGAGQAADGADQLAVGAREAANGASQLSDGADQLADGLRSLESGNRRLELGLEQLAVASPQLADGLNQLLNGTNALTSGLSQIQDGQTQLASGLESGAAQGAPLESGLTDTAAKIATIRDQLVSRTGPFKQLRNLDVLSQKSPNFFRSGYVVVAAVDGARPLSREASLFLVDFRHGGDVGRVQVLPNVPTNDPRTERVVDDIRKVTHKFADHAGLTAAAGGAAGELVDYARVTTARLPFLVFFISLVAYVMLVPILRSLLLPAIAIGLNLVTVGVGFGVLTLLFVGDNPPLGGAGALDVISVAGIFAITFALSIDYQVFLLTRMREEFVRTQSNDSAIQFGIAKTAKIVTGAAAIMIAVFVAFALSKFVIIKQFGVGLAVAVLVDATIVRLALLPAVMRLGGLRTWWIPNWLDERLPTFDVEGSEFEHETEQLRPRLAEA